MAHTKFRRCPNCLANMNQEPGELEARLAASEAENERLWQFVAEQPCECRGEFPNKCDRCTLIEAAKGGK